MMKSVIIFIIFNLHVCINAIIANYPSPKLDAIDTCQVDNWGMPNQSRRPFRTTYKTSIQEKCSSQFVKNISPMATLDNATVNYYPTTPEFNNFVGYDWVPENHHLFRSGAPWGKKLDTTAVKPGSMKVFSCDSQEPSDGSTWTVTRIGPFKTTGGYDWVQIGWDNLWDMRKKLEKYPLGVYMLDQFSDPVLADGTRLGHPPIHVHHIHIGPVSGVRQRTDPRKCFLNNIYCYDPTRIGEHHGDYQCTEADGGLDCNLESNPDGYGKLVTYEIGLEGDLNDIRAPNSESIEWYYELGVRWIPKVSEHNPVRAMSLHNFAGPGDFSFTNQGTFLFTHQHPTDQESIFWYTGRMHHSGSLLRNKQHAHNLIYNEALFFAATPEELGLTGENNLVGSNPYQAIPLKTTRFKSNREVRDYIMGNLKKSAQRAIATNQEHIPRAICHAVSNGEFDERGLQYDRREPTCCTEWDFKEGDVFTTIGFNKKVFAKGTGPSQGNAESDLHIPPTWAGHIGWWLSFDSKQSPEQSHYSFILYTRNKDVQFEIKNMLGAEKLNLGLSGGSFSNYYTVSFFTSYLFVTLYGYPLLLLLFIIIFISSTFLVNCLYRRYKGSYYTKYQLVPSSSTSDSLHKGVNTVDSIEAVDASDKQQLLWGSSSSSSKSAHGLNV